MQGLILKLDTEEYLNSDTKILDALLSLKFESREVGPIDFVEWLSVEPSFPKYYFRSADSGFEIAASGKTLVLSELNCEAASDAADLCALAAKRHPQRDCFIALAGAAFDTDQNLSSAWTGFNKFLFYFPSRLIIRQGDITRQVEISKKIDGLWERFGSNRHTPTFRAHEDHLVNLGSERVDLPSFANWSLGVQKALELIQNGELEKIVLARKSVLPTVSAVSPFLLLSALRSAQSNSAPFFFSPSAEMSFMGVSPERLLALEGSNLSSEAVGGTASLFEQSIERAVSELNSDKKSLHEHELVVAYLVNALSSLSESVSAEQKPGARVLNDLVHLKTSIKAKIKDTTSIGNILSTLHPTPAVSGFPVSDAKQIIRKIEGFNRGWYAGYMGYITANRSEFNVTIRSLLLNHNFIALFAGAGIVAGSDAHSEWQEIERKICIPLEKIAEICRCGPTSTLASVA